MNLLQGSIAFALALAGFATLCTVLIEVYLRGVGQRARDLRDMLRAYYLDVIKPKLKAAGVSNGTALENDFLDTLTTNVLAARLLNDGRQLSRWQKRRLALDSLDTNDFLARVQKTKAFAKLIEKLTPTVVATTAAQPDPVPADPAPADAAVANPAPATPAPATAQDTPADPAKEALLRELAAAYEAFGKATTVYFKERARLLSLWAGIFLALLGNIHAGRIFDAFIKNPDMAVRLEAQAGAIRASLPAASPQAGQTISADLEKVQKELKEYQGIGMPIGWNYYPNCLAGGGEDAVCVKLFGALSLPAKPPESTAQASTAKTAAVPKCLKILPPGLMAGVAWCWDGMLASVATTIGRSLLTFCQWFCTVLVTGLLIGLGGPFWYDLAVKLSTLRALFNGKDPLAEREAQTSKAANPLAQ